MTVLTVAPVVPDRWSSIYSSHHAAVSLVVGTPVAVAVAPVDVLGASIPTVALIAYAVATGVLIDLDHFLIARLRTGTWEAARACLRDPRLVLVSQDRIFDPGSVGILSRLLSHLVLVGVAVGLTALVDASLAVLTAVVLYAHLLSDVAWDVRNLRQIDAYPLSVPDADDGADADDGTDAGPVAEANRER